MAHFPAFYRCCKCKKIIGGVVSNTWLMVDEGVGREIKLLNPQEVEIKGDLKFYCYDCLDSVGPTNAIHTTCYNEACGKSVNIFYWPSKVEIAHEGNIFMVKTKSLLTEYEDIGFCSEECARICRTRDPVVLFDR